MKRPGALVLLAGVLLLAGCAQKIAAAESAKSVAPATSPALATSPAGGRGEWAAVAAASYNTLALKQNGTLWAWGLNDYGQLGQGYEDFTAHAAPRQVGHAHDWMAISGGYADSFALKKDGTLWAWGNNTDSGGNLGLGRSRVMPPGPGLRDQHRPMDPDAGRQRTRLGGRLRRIRARSGNEEGRHPLGLGAQLVRRSRRGHH